MHGTQGPYNDHEHAKTTAEHRYRVIKGPLTTAAGYESMTAWGRSRRHEFNEAMGTTI